MALIAKIADKRILVTSALLFAVYLALDDFVTGLPHLVKALDIIPGNWNWTGKLLSLVLSAIVLFALKLSPDAVGLRKQEHSKITWIAVGLFIVRGTCLGLLFNPARPMRRPLHFRRRCPAWPKRSPSEG